MPPTFRADRPFLDAVRSSVLVVDGAMGTQLYERGVLYSACFEELNVSRPELVSKVHEDYLRAAPRSSRPTPSARTRCASRSTACRARARAQRGRRPSGPRSGAGQAYVVGAIGPSGYFLGEASAEDLAKVKAAFAEQARTLVESGVDGLLVETFRQTAELRVAVEAAVEAAEGRLPVIASGLARRVGGRMADGTDAAEEIARLVKEWGARHRGQLLRRPDGVFAAVERMVPALGCPCLPRRTPASPAVDERMVYVSTPEYFGVYARRMVQARRAARRRLLRDDARAHQAHRRRRAHGG
jgi:methionine synthase I (cobalamin-dependent)